MVLSNDPIRPSATLKISASIEVEFGFETNTLNMGQISRGETATKTATLLLKDISKRNLVAIGTGSSNISAKVLESNSANAGRIDVQVMVNPDYPIGRLNEIVTAKLTDDSHPAATLRVVGSVQGNVRVAPEAVHFTIDSSYAVTGQAVRDVKVISTQPNISFEVTSIEDEQNLLEIALDTIVTGREYVIKTEPNDNALRLNRVTSGRVLIKTNDVEQPKVSFSYRLIFTRQ